MPFVYKLEKITVLQKLEYILYLFSHDDLYTAK